MPLRRMFLIVTLPVGWACGAADVPAEPGVPVRTAVVDLQIGELQGDDAYVFGRVSGITLDADGRIFVAAGQANEVRVFDRHGAYLFTIGRAGAGPGELDRPCCVAFGPAGRLWVRDGNGRYNVYEVGDDGAYVGMRRMAHGSPGFPGTTTFDAGGHLVDVGFDFSGGLPPAVTRYHLDSTSAVVRTVSISTPPPDSTGMHEVVRRSAQGISVTIFEAPFGSRHLVGHGPGGDWAEASSARYHVEWHRGSGDATMVVARTVEPPAVTDGERARAAEDLEPRLERAGVTMGDLPFDIPDRKAPILTLLFDVGGRLWVERSVPDGAPRRADVWDADGTLVEIVEWPADVSLGAGYLSDTELLGVRRDELDVPSVVRLVVQR